MDYHLVMPKLGETMKEGTVIRWAKKEGDQVLKGEIIAEIEAEKANVDLDTMRSGRLKAILVPEGETVSVGTPIALLEELV